MGPGCREALFDRAPEGGTPRAGVAHGHQPTRRAHARFRKLVLVPVLAIRTVLEADDPELGRVQRVGNCVEQDGLPEAVCRRPEHEVAARHRREQVERTNPRRHNLSGGFRRRRFGRAQRAPIVRGAAEGVGSLGIGTRGEQRRHEMVVLALDRRVQRRRTVEGGHVGIGARREQELDDVGVPGDGRDPQR